MFFKLLWQIESIFSSIIWMWGYSLIQNELFVYILPDLVVASWYSVCGPTVWRKQISWHLQWILLILSFEESFAFFSIISSRLQLTPIEPVKKTNKKNIKQFQDCVPALCSCALCPPGTCECLLRHYNKNWVLRWQGALFIGVWVKVTQARSYHINF